MVKSDVFSAADSALGYLYQCRMGLWLMFQQLRVNPESSISIEKFDDVAFDDSGSPIELIQTKHHLSKAGSLSNGSADLWKTIRVWSTQLKQGDIFIPGTVLTLITTSNAPPLSACSYLRINERNPKTALEILEKTARQDLAKNKKEKSKKAAKKTAKEKALSAFMELSSNERFDLVSAINILDNAPVVSEIAKKLEGELRIFVREEHLEPFRERLEGWWFTRVISHMSSKLHGEIACKSLQDQVQNLIEQFKQDSLPIDYILAEPPKESPLRNQERTFIQQLKLIALGDKSIEYAIIDFYRAFEQRSRWVREDLLLGDELEVYEKKLIEEWDRYFVRLKEALPSSAKAADHIKVGKNVYDWAQRNHPSTRIRPSVTEEYVSRGSFHMLADERRVGWHPIFLQKLEALLVRKK